MARNNAYPPEFRRQIVELVRSGRTAESSRFSRVLPIAPLTCYAHREQEFGAAVVCYRGGFSHVSPAEYEEAACNQMAAPIEPASLNETSRRPPRGGSLLDGTIAFHIDQ